MQKSLRFVGVLFHRCWKKTLTPFCLVFINSKHKKAYFRDHIHVCSPLGTEHLDRNSKIRLMCFEHSSWVASQTIWNKSAFLDALLCQLFSCFFLAFRGGSQQSGSHNSTACVCFSFFTWICFFDFSSAFPKCLVGLGNTGGQKWEIRQPRHDDAQVLQDLFLRVQSCHNLMDLAVSSLLCMVWQLMHAMSTKRS